MTDEEIKNQKLILALKEIKKHSGDKDYNNLLSELSDFNNESQEKINFEILAQLAYYQISSEDDLSRKLKINSKS